MSLVEKNQLSGHASARTDTLRHLSEFGADSPRIVGAEVFVREASECRVRQGAFASRQRLRHLTRSQIHVGDARAPLDMVKPKYEPPRLDAGVLAARKRLRKWGLTRDFSHQERRYWHRTARFQKVLTESL